MGNESTIRAAGKQGYIYIGGYQPHADVLYLKAGKTTRPKERVRDYGGMIPGGLSFMRAAKVVNASRGEAELLASLARIEGVEPVGGEWFRCAPIMKLTALDELHRIGTEVVQVHAHCPPLFGEKRQGKRGKRRG